MSKPDLNRITVTAASIGDGPYQDIGLSRLPSKQAYRERIIRETASLAADDRPLPAAIDGCIGLQAGISPCDIEVIRSGIGLVGLGSAWLCSIPEASNRDAATLEADDPVHIRVTVAQAPGPRVISTALCR